MIDMEHRRDFNALEEFSGYYLETVRAEFAGLPEPGEPCEPERKQAWTLAMQAHGAGATDLGWAGLFAFENAVARLQSVERVRRRLVALREKFRGLVGQPGYEAYLKCAIPDLRTATEPELRAEIESLLGEFHWYYSATSTRDALFRRMRRSITWPLGIYGAFVLAYGWVAYLTGGWMPGLLVFVFAGGLGAYVSILRRMKDAQNHPVSPMTDPVAALTELGAGSLSVWSALMSGAIFPALLLLVFASGLVSGNGTGLMSGSIFPNIATPRGGPSLRFLDFALRTGPQTGVDYSKMLVWSFVAGFAERFVPDILDKLVAKGSQTPAVAAAPGAPQPLPPGGNGSKPNPAGRSEAAPAAAGGR